MKVYWLIIPLLLFVGVSTYADIYRGYRTIDCTGEYLIADSLIDLYKQDGQEGPDGEVWNFESYIELPFIEECRKFSGTVAIIVKILLANDDTPPVVFLPVPIPFTIPFADFDEKANQKLLDSWLEKAVERLPDWRGTESTATLATEIEVEWKINKTLNDPETEHGRLAQIDFKKEPWEIELFLDNIYKKAMVHKIPPEHLIILAQMEEIIHAKQGAALDPWEDGTGYDPRADPIAMEVEAKLDIENKFWPILYGMYPPMIMVIPDPPVDKNYHKKREAFHKLVKKLINKGKLGKTDTNRYDDLLKYFETLNETTQIVGAINAKYEGKADNPEVE